MAWHWQTAPELEVEYAISCVTIILRMAEFTKGVTPYLTRLFLGQPKEHTVSLSKRFHFKLPTDVDSCEYEVNLLVLDLASLNPTVCLDAWESKGVLVALNFAESK